MAVIRYFGLPRCGKTTLIAKMALEAVKSKQFKNVYCNVHLSIPGVIYVPFRECFGKYEIVDGIYFIDEAAIEAGDREYKSFGPERTAAIMLHGHDKLILVFFSQEPDGVDKKIRAVTEEVYYVKKSKVFKHWTYVYRIPYKLIWPKEGSDGENAGKILMGYVKPPFLSRVFALRFCRKKYYKYFDSWEREPRPPLPDKYSAYVPPAAREPLAASGWWHRIAFMFSRKSSDSVSVSESSSDD